MEFAVLANHNEEIEESEKINNYLGLARELKNMKVTVIPIVVGALGTVTKGL